MSNFDVELLVSKALSFAVGGPNCFSESRHDAGVFELTAFSSGHWRLLPWKAAPGGASLEGQVCRRPVQDLHLDRNGVPMRRSGQLYKGRCIVKVNSDNFCRYVVNEHYDCCKLLLYISVLHIVLLWLSIIVMIFTIVNYYYKKYQMYS